MLSTVLLLLWCLATPGDTLNKPNNETQQYDFSHVYDNYEFSYDEEETFPDAEIIFDDNATVRINKCCDLGEALDDRYRCLRVNGTLESFEFLLKRMVSENMTVGVDTRLPCAKKLIKELEPTNLAPNGSFKVYSTGVYTTAYHCLDLIQTHGSLDLHLLSCDHDTTGFLTKCCPSHQLLSPDLSHCVALPEGDAGSGASWLPPRSVADPQTFLPTGQYRTQTLSTLPQVCPGLRAQADVFHQVFSDGTVHVEDQENGFKTQEFDCIDRQLTLTNEVTNPAAISCKIPVPKCCPDREIFSQEDSRCLHTDREEDGRMDLSLLQPDSFLIVPDSLPDNLTEAYWEQMSGLELQNNKTLVLKSGGGSFCIENILTRKNASVETRIIAILEEGGVPDGRFLFSFPFNNNLAQTQNRTHKARKTPLAKPTTYLYSEDTENCDAATLGFYSFLGIVSITSLVTTVIIYTILPELRNLHGLILISCALSTLFATLFLVIVYNNPATDGSFSCSVLGYFGVFFNLAMFTWMTLMCWDLARTLRRMRPPTSKQQWSKFLAYSSMGWGLPLLATVITGFCQVYVSPASHFNPRIGVKQCFVESSGHRQLIFFHLPMFLIILINAGAFAFSIYHIRQTQAGAAAGKRTGTQERNTQLVSFGVIYCDHLLNLFAEAVCQYVPDNGPALGL